MPGKSLVLKALPTVWSFHSRAQACGLHVDDNEVWGGWENGLVAAVDHKGKLLRRWRLPGGVDAVIADEAWRYAGCHDGNVYDLTGKTPRVAYEVGQDARIHWIDVFRGNLCASDDTGACTVVDADQQLMWKAAPKGASAGWMVRADNDGVYVGNSKGVAKYDWKGKKKWAAPGTKQVGFGWQEDERVFAFVGFHQVKNSAVVAIDKKSGKVVARGSTFSKHKHYTPSINAASCAAVGTTRMYAATCETLFCYDGAGKLLWEAPTSTGTPCSMAVHGDRLYVITHNGHLSAIDVSDKAIAAAKTKAGRTAKAKKVAIPKIEKKVETVAAKSAKGVIVECFKDGSKTRVRVVSPGYNADWFCQFPRDIREAGARFAVDEVREASQGGFYRVLGNIRKLR